MYGMVRYQKNSGYVLERISLNSNLISCSPNFKSSPCNSSDYTSGPEYLSHAASPLHLKLISWNFDVHKSTRFVTDTLNESINGNAICTSESFFMRVAMGRDVFVILGLKPAECLCRILMSSRNFKTVNYIYTLQCFSGEFQPYNKTRWK